MTTFKSKLNNINLQNVTKKEIKVVANSNLLTTGWKDYETKEMTWTFSVIFNPSVEGHVLVKDV